MHRLVEPVGEVRQLAVDLHADRLERAARRVRAPPARGGGDRVADDVSASSRVECSGPGRDDRVGDAAREPLLAVLRDDRGELRLVVAVHDVGGGERLLGVHAHVERRVEAVREAALGPVELRAADPEIHQDAHHFVPLAVAFDELAEPLETAVHHLRPCAEAREPGASGGHGVGVTVDAEQTHVGPRVEQQGRVACATDRAVDDQPGGHRQEEFHHFPAHDREMRELRLHVGSSPLHRIRVAADPVFSPPVDRHRPGCLPGTATAESGRSRGQQPRRPGD